jgi:hypothetical protein
VTMCHTCYSIVTDQITRLVAKHGQSIALTTIVYRDLVFHNTLNDDSKSAEKKIEEMVELSIVIAEVCDALEDAAALFPVQWETMMDNIRQEMAAGKAEDETVARAAQMLGDRS